MQLKVVYTYQFMNNIVRKWIFRGLNKSFVFVKFVPKLPYIGFETFTKSLWVCISVFMFPLWSACCILGDHQIREVPCHHFQPRAQKAQKDYLQLPLKFVSIFCFSVASSLSVKFFLSVDEVKDALVRHNEKNKTNFVIDTNGSKSFIIKCAHGVKRKSRSKGKRPSQHVNYLG